MKRKFGVSWWLWLITACALGTHLAGWRFGLPLTAALAVVLVAHQGWRARTAGTLSLQVRTLFMGFLLLGIWPPLRALHALQLAGTAVLLVLDYCVAGRFLSLMPWNRKRPLTLRLVRVAFTRPRVPGCQLSLPDESRLAA